MPFDGEGTPCFTNTSANEGQHTSVWCLISRQSRHVRHLESLERRFEVAFYRLEKRVPVAPERLTMSFKNNCGVVIGEGIQTSGSDIAHSGNPRTKHKTSYPRIQLNASKKSGFLSGIGHWNFIAVLNGGDVVESCIKCRAWWMPTIFTRRQLSHMSYWLPTKFIF